MPKRPAVRRARRGYRCPEDPEEEAIVQKASSAPNVRIGPKADIRRLFRSEKSYLLTALSANFD
jgi:hypothetical protein